MADNELNIARRTRSHLIINDFVPNDDLDFPDVDINLYQDPDSVGDVEYKNFLYQCYGKEIETESNTEDNDPAYVYNDDIFSHGWRFNLDEVNQEETAKKSPVNPEFARILNQQLRQSIQLITQTFLLTKNTKNMQDEAERAKSHLLSYMKVFENKSKPSNLLSSLELVSNLATPKNLINFIRLSWRPLQIPESVKSTLNNNPKIFIYHSLLPQVAFSNIPERLTTKKPKVNFTEDEDKLLAFALNEFKNETSPYAFIASLLMTAKTKTQISNHIKNIKRSPGNENNPIKLYYANGDLPDIDLDSDSRIIVATHVQKNEDEEERYHHHHQYKHQQHQHSMFQHEHQQQLVVDQKQKYNHHQDQQEQLSSHQEQHSHLQRQQQQLAPQQEHQQQSQSSLQQQQHQFPIQQEEQQIHQQQQVQLYNIMDTPYSYQEYDDVMNMDLDDLMAASSTISKSTPLIVSNGENNKNVKNLKLKKSMLNLMSHNFLLSKDMGDLIIHEFLSVAQNKLSERNYLHLLQLLSQLMKIGTKKDDQTVVTIYQEISKFLQKIKAPTEIQERIVLFLDLNQANKCGCSFSYLHWMRFFEFMQHVELHHDGVEAFEKKLARLVDSLQKDDSHKVKLAITNLVNKHPYLKREFDSLSLDEKPHPSLFICEEDFDDITEPIGSKENNDKYEHFKSQLSEGELSYATQACPCICHSGQPSRHCFKCNLKFIKGRVYLVDKIKPILAEWSYTPDSTPLRWTLEEDREILEFCRSKAEQNEETVSFDTSTFEELVNNRGGIESYGGSNVGICSKRNAREISERFNQLMELYKDEASSGVQ